MCAYRYRVAGRRDCRRADSARGPRRRRRFGTGCRGWGLAGADTIRLGEWLEEYLQTHPGERVTTAKLRWLLCKATAAGDVRLSDLVPEAHLELHPEGVTEDNLASLLADVDVVIDAVDFLCPERKLASLSS